ncbi:hypothetical protein [Pseudomonas sp. Z4-20]|uniref:hypothetical protein n=1 Tax=unclassified Pseudomonas TaxID=196821 RepID=UPI003DAA4143
MSDELYKQKLRFQTPDPGFGPREQSPMLPQEAAWARERAFMHRFSWVMVLAAPVSIGLMLPSLAFVIVLGLVEKWFVPGLDIDRIIVGSWGWQVLATVLFVAGWALSNYRRDSRDPIKRYWQSMQDRGVVELERHTLISGISLWANDVDPDCSSVMQWKNDTLVREQASGVSQWILAMTTAGHWLVLREEFPGAFRHGPVGRMPAPDERMKPRQQLAITFVPGTQVTLGERFDGAPLPLTDSSYWMSADEFSRLAEASHRWTCLPPDRYAVVNDRDADWVQRLVATALGGIGPQPGRPAVMAERPPT